MQFTTAHVHFDTGKITISADGEVVLDLVSDAFNQNSEHFQQGLNFHLTRAVEAACRIGADHERRKILNLIRACE